MGRVNKKTEGVFVDIVGSPREISSYDRFINSATDDLKNMTSKSKRFKELSTLLNQYKSLITKNKDIFDELAKLEEVILEIRSREHIEDIKLSLVRQYIYARSPFYRKGKKSKDIRVLVDNAEFWSQNIDELYKNKDFMEKAKTMLGKVMEKEIDDNLKTIK